MKISKVLFISLIILALNCAFLLTQFYLFQNSIIYFELYEALLEDIHLIDIPAIIFDSSLYFILSIVIFFALLIIFLNLVNQRFINSIFVEKNSLCNSFIYNKLKERSPPQI